MRGAALGVALALLATAPSAAQSLRETEWLPRGSRVAERLIARPAERLAGGEAQSFFVEYGRLLFRSPEVLGGNARKAGLSCNACHTNGHVNRSFFIPGLSDAPGRVDISDALWHARAANGRFDPLDIPSLRGARGKDRFGQDRRTASLREFTRSVMVLEFAGRDPDALTLDALVAYQSALEPAGEEEVPVTLAGELADLRRYLAVLALPLAEEDVMLAQRIAGLVRYQVGLVHERFHGPAHAPARAVLEGWAAALAEIERSDEAIGSRARLAALRAELANPPAALTDAAATSLYDPAELKAAVAPTE